MRDLDGECVTGGGNTRGGVILVAAPGFLISVIFEVWNVTVFLLSGLYITILISASFWLAMMYCLRFQRFPLFGKCCPSVFYFFNVFI